MMTHTKEPAPPKRPAEHRRLHEAVQEEIANIYFQTSDAKKAPEKPKRKAAKQRSTKVPWAIAAVAVVFALAVLIFKSNIDVKVRILGEIPIIKTSDLGGRQAYENGVYILKDGMPDKYTVKRELFLGDARLLRNDRVGELALYNDRGPGWANYTLELKEPIDLTKLDLKYIARGDRGDEFLTIVLVDAQSKVYRMEKDLSSELKKAWQTYQINFRPVRNAIDLTNITTIRFEFGGLTAGNYPTTTIFLKNIYFTKSKRLLWL